MVWSFQALKKRTKTGRSMRLGTGAKGGIIFSSIGITYSGEFMSGSWNFHISLAKYLNMIETRFYCSYTISLGETLVYIIFLIEFLKLSSIINTLNVF